MLRSSPSLSSSFSQASPYHLSVVFRVSDKPCTCPHSEGPHPTEYLLLHEQHIRLPIDGTAGNITAFVTISSSLRNQGNDDLIYGHYLANFMILFTTLGCITKSARTLDVPSLLLAETFTATVTCTQICELPQLH